MITPSHLREDIIVPTLKAIDAYSRNATELLMLTAAQESHLGKYLHQINGPAIGIFQMEPATHKDIWENYLKYKEELAWAVTNFGCPSNHFKNNGENHPEAEQMKGNLYYAAAMARCLYLRQKESLPEHDDVVGMARYYKKYYNTPMGAATEEEAVENYKKFVLA